MKQKINSPVKRQQQGIAAVMFAIMIPVLFMFIALGMDGAHFLRARARAGDAAEVAALALSARGSDKASIYTPIARNYLEYLNPGATGITIRRVTHTVCDPDGSSGCDPDPNGRRYFQFELVGEANYESLFPTFNKKLGFGEEVSTQGHAMTRKYQGTTVDVVLITDFSGSMKWSWDGKVKINMLKTVVKGIAEELEEFVIDDKKNTLAVVPFNWFTMNKGESATCYVENLVHKYSEEQGGWYIDYVETVEKMFIAKPVRCYDDYIVGGFHTEPLSENVENVASALSSMTAGGGTSSYEGIMRGGQIALGGKNQRRLLVVLSDGQDNQPEIHQKLLEKGYCNLIRNHLDSMNTPEGDDVQSKIAVIGFNYDAESDPNLQRCAGEANVFTATSMEDVYNKLMELISEEVGRLYTKPKGTGGTGS